MAGSLSFEQACAMIVEQSVGTAATSAKRPDRRRAGGAARGTGAHRLGRLRRHRWDPFARTDCGSCSLNLMIPMALATFSSIFKFVGILAFYPWLDRFAPYYRADFWSRHRDGCQPPRPGPRRGAARARGSLAGDPGACAWFGRRVPLRRRIAGGRLSGPAGGAGGRGRQHRGIPVLRRRATAMASSMAVSASLVSRRRRTTPRP